MILAMRQRCGMDVVVDRPGGGTRGYSAHRTVPEDFCERLTSVGRSTDCCVYRSRAHHLKRSYASKAGRYHRFRSNGSSVFEGGD